MTADASRVLLAHTDDETVAEELRTTAYVQYLRRSTAGPVAVGDKWSEVVSDGCGQTTRVTLTVRAVQDGRRIGPETAIEYELANG
ncbi:hypothetical protein [Halorubrum lacusprofundi]|jgi:hypothetical protein|uniref:hypothetical protein n=1 Tax=Halorubrum lacusprofundi TaxID=2247 RepID=UPI000B5A9A64|nr:hypothetical protein [Halorubrum lacusprofundi]MCG1007574.1 hypothetical protein [Halorubrum lacusprofundi]